MKKDHLYLIAILMAGIIARIIKFDDPAMVMDTVAFSRLGKNLFEYGRYVFGENYNMGVFFPPGYPMFIGIFNLVLKDLIFSAKLVSLAASCLSILFSYLIGKELYNRQAGLFAALVFALYPVLLIISVDVYADSLFFCLILLTLYLFIRLLRKDSYFLSVMLGLSMGVMFLTRPEGMFLFLLPLARILGIFDGKLQFNKRYCLQAVLIIVLFAALISPYMLYIKNYTGKFSVSGKGNISILLGELSGDREYHEVVNAPENLYDRAAFALNEDKTQLRGWNRKENLSVGKYLLKDPVNLLKRYQKNVMRQIGTLIKLLIPFMLPLFFSLFNRDLLKNRMLLAILLYSGLFFLMYPLFIIIEKQTLLIVIFLILFSSGGFSASRIVFSDILNYYGVQSTETTLIIERSLKPLIVIMLIISSLSYLKYSRFENTQSPLEHIAAGEYLSKNVVTKYEQINIMARKPYVNFYSDARFTMIPYAPVKDVLSFARLYKVDYIVVDERFIGRWDAYDELLKLENHSTDVELVYEGADGPMIRIFKLSSGI